MPITVYTNIVVPISPSMSGTSYIATAALSGTAANLDNVDLIGITARTASTVTVTVHNTSLVGIASGAITVEVIAAKP